jgi:hypothetical protein
VGSGQRRLLDILEEWITNEQTDIRHDGFHVKNHHLLS